MHDANNLRLRTPRPPWRILVVALLGVALALLVACAGDEDGDTTAAAAAADEPAEEATSDMGGSTRSPAQDAEMAIEEAPAEEAGTEETSLAVPTALTPADLGREIIYRATIGVQADDVTAASNEAVAIVQGLGGIVFSQTTRTEPQPWAEIVFKVLPADFSTALERLAGVGKLVDQSISADDVTERVVDLESRISTAETSVDRLRRLLEEAVDLEDVAEIERQLLDRETTLEVLRGQLRTLRGQVDLATITLTITQSPTVPPDTGIVVAAWVSDDADDPCLGAQHLTADPDSTVYLCLEVENPGASTLTDVSVRSLDVRLDIGGFEARQGGFDRIEPGGLLVAVLEIPVEDGRLAGRVAARGLEIRLEAEAVPVDAEGTELPEVSGSTFVWLDSHTDDSLPGFRDSISDGAGFLRSLGGVALVVIGVLIPFLPFVAVIIALIWWSRRRRRARKQASAPPPPPAS